MPTSGKQATKLQSSASSTSVVPPKLEVILQITANLPAFALPTTTFSANKSLDPAKEKPMESLSASLTAMTLEKKAIAVICSSIPGIVEIKPVSLRVKLRCDTEEEFLQVWKNYESGDMEEHLKTFFNSENEVERLKIEIENLKEVNDIRQEIEKSSSKTENMARRGNRCDTDCHKIYPGRDGHIKQRRDEDLLILGSAGQFCAAFYHVHKWGRRNHYCLDQRNCIIGQRAKRESDWRFQAKTVVAVVKFKDECGNTLYEARYTNCNTDQKHAEDFFEDDIRNEDGNLRRLVEAPNRKGSITLYLMYQPCNKSILTQTTPRDKSCCDKLIRIYEKKLNPRDISLCVKAANTYRLEVEDGDADFPEEEEEVPSYQDRNTARANGILRRNAVRGIRRLIEKGVKFREMREEAWDYLFTMTNFTSNVPREYKLRDDLDDSVHSKLSI